MTRTEFDALCAAKPGAVLSSPGELDAWKVGGRMFACFGHVETRPANTGAVSVKCADVETAQMLIAAGVAVKAAYFHRSWVSLPLATLDAGDAQHRINASYASVVSKLPKKLQAVL
ncbi:MAG: MmcQ/YjbR family DNA-binding protein [Rhodobacteraceae bacterium]|nr:MmcQ/YjbR family DNA-binding protein [Paracoccaceae bacterium]